MVKTWWAPFYRVVKFFFAKKQHEKCIECSLNKIDDRVLRKLYPSKSLYYSRKNHSPGILRLISWSFGCTVCIRENSFSDGDKNEDDNEERQRETTSKASLSGNLTRLTCVEWKLVTLTLAEPQQEPHISQEYRWTNSREPHLFSLFRVFEGTLEDINLGQLAKLIVSFLSSTAIRSDYEFLDELSVLIAGVAARLEPAQRVHHASERCRSAWWSGWWSWFFSSGNY